jgi:hypothetical protein
MYETSKNNDFLGFCYPIFQHINAHYSYFKHYYTQIIYFRHHDAYFNRRPKTLREKIDNIICKYSLLSIFIYLA